MALDKGEFLGREALAGEKESAPIRLASVKLESRSGVLELRHVRSFTSEHEGRLKCIAERVLVTKKDWGSRSLAVAELARLRSWIGPG